MLAAGKLGFELRIAAPRKYQPSPDLIKRAGGKIIVTDNRAGIALVTLPANFFDKVPVTDQRLATAQIVLTLTDSRGIGQVQFDQAVPKPSGALAPAGKPLTHADYASMLNAPSSSTSTSSTSSTGP
jgi:hypothetical protein